MEKNQKITFGILIQKQNIMKKNKIPKKNNTSNFISFIKKTEQKILQKL